MGESDAGYMATLIDWELNDYRETLEWTLAQAELPKLSRPREELQAAASGDPSGASRAYRER